jgi:hypothetical protein
MATGLDPARLLTVDDYGKSSITRRNLTLRKKQNLRSSIFESRPAAKYGNNTKGCFKILLNDKDCRVKYKQGTGLKQE